MGLAKGLVQVYTGEGKGKTTAALGLALRAVGRGLKVVVIQFLKADGATGELMAARRLSPELEIKSMGRPGFIGPEGPTAEDIALAGAALEAAGRQLDRGDCDLLVLDEVNVAFSMGLVSEAAILELMERKPPHMELVLTGRGAPAAVLERAHLVTTMAATRHYFDEGEPARKGIEH